VNLIGISIGHPSSSSQMMKMLQNGILETSSNEVKYFAEVLRHNDILKILRPMQK
jgi:hypothetical protein